MKRKTATMDQVMAMNPCVTYTRERVAELFGRRKTMDARDIARLPIRIVDRIWALFRLEMISREALTAFAVDCALRAEEYSVNAPTAAAATYAAAAAASTYANAAYAVADADAYAFAATASATYAASAAASSANAATYAASAAASSANAATYAATAAASSANAAANATSTEREIQDESLLAYVWFEEKP